MAAGDITISLAVEGGITKTVSLGSAIRVKSKLLLLLDEDAEWAVRHVNISANLILSEANRQLESEATWTPATFTAAT